MGDSPVVTEIKQHDWPRALWWRCAGCDEVHRVYIEKGGSPRWKWNGSLSKPTLTPSIRVRGRITCHSFVTDGVVKFLTDCQHDLAGQSVPMKPEDADPYGS